MINIEQIETEPFEYSDYYVAFLDILGFKKLVANDSPENIGKISEYFGLIHDVTEKLKKIKPKSNLGSIIISDSVILSVPKNNSIQENIETLRHLCVAVAKIQYVLALKNIWLRGAISSGKAFFDSVKNNVVGQAYINAYLLEKKRAVYPRVILDNKIIEELGHDSARTLIAEINFKNDPENRFPEWQTDILFDWANNHGINGRCKIMEQDVALFIDYLSPIVGDIDQVRHLVKEIKKNVYSDNKIYSKFRWVLHYLQIKCLLNAYHHEPPQNREEFMKEGYMMMHL